MTPRSELSVPMAVSANPYRSRYSGKSRFWTPSVVVVTRQTR
jgi:hypothetical protein